MVEEGTVPKAIETAAADLPQRHHRDRGLGNDGAVKGAHVNHTERQQSQLNAY